jgi:hypothetical protein
MRCADRQNVHSLRRRVDGPLAFVGIESLQDRSFALLGGSSFELSGCLESGYRQAAGNVPRADEEQD